MPEMLELTAHGRSYRMYETGGKISRSMRAGRPYEARLLEHIYDEGFSDVAVDVGANIGNHTLWMAAICELAVVAFEPLHVEILEQHVALNRLEAQIRIEGVALGDSDGRASHVGKGRLDPDGDSDGREDLAADVASGRWIGAGVTVPTRTLDSYELHNVSLIKIDVEGMEPHVLRGSLDTIRRCQPVIFAEAWRDPPKRRQRRAISMSHRRIAEILEPLGYRCAREFAANPQTTPVERWEPR